MIGSAADFEYAVALFDVLGQALVFLAAVVLVVGVAVTGIAVVLSFLVPKEAEPLELRDNEEWLDK